MVKLAAYAEFTTMLDRAAGFEDKLLPNELEMLHSLAAKYCEPLTPDPFDVTALDVILRNIEVRKGCRFDVKKRYRPRHQPAASQGVDPIGCQGSGASSTLSRLKGRPSGGGSSSSRA